DDVWQGYGGIAIHPATGDAIATWHQDDAVLGYGTTICYDDFALLNVPGFWSAYLFIPPPLPDEYIWPYLYVGPSPLGEDYVRVYHISKNYTHNVFEHPCENPRIMYIDIENSLFTDMTVLLDLANWTEVIVMYEWREKDCRPLSQPFTIDPNTPGKVTIMGYVSWLSGDLGDMPVEPGIFVWESYDYGETWDTANLHSSGSENIYFVDNIPGFIDNQGNIIDIIEVGVYGWHNTAVYDNEGALHLTYMQQYGFTDATGSYYWPHFLPEAQATWDGTDFTFDEVPEMPGIDPLSGHSVPWEIVTDPFSGELDTLLYTTVGFSMYPGEANIFHENTQKNAINFENGWILQMWADGTYVQLAQDGIPEYLPYLEHPIIFISVSSDNGNTWSEPIELTDIFDEYGEPTEFYDKITVYPYVCDQITDLGDDWGMVYIYYLDDNSFGSSVQGQGQNLGGQITYCSIKIKFPTIAVEPDNPHISELTLINYPNPFTSYTHISFSAPKGLNNPSIKIYNIKGELVKHLSIFNNQSSIEWDGKDSNNNDVVSGIYLYKLETDKGSITKKMLLSR
ncbi:MAG: T9SS type A sorting domain-containing protein, partial [Candidatus Cloacimonetes bacterium]|nr:T9SS type A sorting domain-containing protein [Candidatus Cloacimonadota bacterium]